MRIEGMERAGSSSGKEKTLASHCEVYLQNAPRCAAPDDATDETKTVPHNWMHLGRRQAAAVGAMS
jgi:hypothetical protein